MSTDYRYAAMMRDVGEIMAQDASALSAEERKQLEDLRVKEMNTKLNSKEIEKMVYLLSKARGTGKDEALKPKLVPTPKVGPGGDAGIKIPPPKDPKLRAEWEAGVKRREAEGKGKYVGDAGPLSIRTDEMLIAQINTSLRLQNKPEIKKGQVSRAQLEAMYRKVNGDKAMDSLLYEWTVHYWTKKSGYKIIKVNAADRQAAISAAEQQVGETIAVQNAVRGKLFTGDLRQT